ncbi:hypothetical protein [Minwuia sp.]|uniref:hypothetical protein n=1 Tax=Minwuia sp. TaxID=2493630 RepID=UPI003A9103D3
MTFPEWTKPALLGAAAGAVAISIVGFSWGGWVTASSARGMASDHARSEVTAAMVPHCLEMSADDPQRMTKLAAIRDANGYNRRKAVEESGWATMPGETSPDRHLAEACAEKLDLEES